MKILQINKFYYLQGGAERSFFNLGKVLGAKKHEVIPFSMQHPQNKATSYSQYFVSCVDFNTNGHFYPKLTMGIKSIYSVEARKKLSELIKTAKPDIAHIHAFCYQLTPSIFFALEQASIPIVQTSRNYKLICPNQRLFNLYSEKICEACKGGRYYKAISNKCIKNSYSASALGCMEAYIYHALGTYSKTINKIIAPSNFLRKKLIEFSLKPEQITHIPNFVNIQDYIPCFDYSDYFVYVGRLAALKGINTLVSAMKQIKGYKLYVVGTGELEAQLKDYVVVEGINNIKFLGYKQGNELKNILKNSMFSIITSQCYENCPNSVLESLALGKPVIGANIGGIPELINDGVDGLLFEPRNVDDLAAKIQYLLDNKHLLPEMGRQGRKKIEQKYNAQTHYERLMQLYESVLNKGKVHESPTA